MANTETKPNASPRYKSQHLNTIRSMHMIQELQSYIENLENLAQQQKEEIHRVNEQNKVWKRQTKNPTVRSKLGEEFAGDGTDLPPKLRASLGVSSSPEGLQAALASATYATTIGRRP